MALRAYLLYFSNDTSCALLPPGVVVEEIELQKIFPFLPKKHQTVAPFCAFDIKKAEEYKDECLTYCEYAVQKIANVLRFAENSLGKSQEFTTLCSGMIASENFIALVTEIGWHEIYDIISDELGMADDSLKKKALQALKDLK